MLQYYAMGWVYNMQQAISHLSNITHLMVSYYPQGFELRVWQVLLSIISDDLSPIERLVILKHPLNFTDGEWSPASAEQSDDQIGESSKIVWVEAGVGWTMKDDWKRRCRGDMDTWDQAEVIAEKRGW
ncbi:hypothetical protein DL96DRAFT_1682891 [Flagelloscypha sp. PMI_526]|nr:hypothetical protein DL96DRAFT_1682891 [Flagelloscypha sp. PMI_526]